MISNFDSLVNLIYQYFRTNKTSLIDNSFMNYLIDNVDKCLDLSLAIKEGKRCYCRLRSRRCRIKNRIVNFKHAYFLTFTISNSNYGLELSTYIRALKSSLSIFDSYVANSDIAPDTGRLHFHAIVDYKDDTLSKSDIDWSYGFISAVKCYSLMHKYLYKVVNHSLKKGTSNLIYSRKKRK